MENQPANRLKLISILGFRLLWKLKTNVKCTWINSFFHLCVFLIIENRKQTTLFSKKKNHKLLSYQKNDGLEVIWEVLTNKDSLESSIYSYKVYFIVSSITSLLRIFHNLYKLWLKVQTLSNASAFVILHLELLNNFQCLPYFNMLAIYLRRILRCHMTLLLQKTDWCILVMLMPTWCGNSHPQKVRYCCLRSSQH